MVSMHFRFNVFDPIIAGAKSLIQGIVVRELSIDMKFFPKTSLSGFSMKHFNMPLEG